jgi:hypothetical protein
MRCGVCNGIAAQLVVGPKGVERRASIGQQVFAPFLAQAHGVGEYGKRIGFGQSRNSVETTRFEQLLRERLCGRRKRVAQLFHDARRQRAIEYGARAVVLGRILLQDEARRTPRLLLGEVAHADATARTKS